MKKLKATIYDSQRKRGVFSRGFSGGTETAPLPAATINPPGAKKMSSPAELWSDYDGSGDQLVKDKVSRAKFVWILRFLTFADYRELETAENGDGSRGKVLKDAKVKPFMDALQAQAKVLWDVGQCVTVDEACCKCKSRYCTIKQRNAAKPIRIHIKIYCCNCSETGYCFGYSVYRGAGSGTVAEIVNDQLFQMQWNGTDKVVVMDNFFSGHDVSHGLMTKHDAFSVTMVAPRTRTDKAQRSIRPEDFPFRKPGNATANALPRGWCQMAKSTIEYTDQHGKAGTYTKYAVLWKDTKLTGLSTNWFKGTGEQFTVQRRLRRKGGASSEVNAFEAIIW